MSGYGIVPSPQGRENMAEPPKKKQRTCAGIVKFQGKWDTNLGILHINGNRGYYGAKMSNHTIVNKFIDNIVANFDGSRIKGKWHWDNNDQTFGRFELNLEPSARSFSGTWGWHRRWKGGGLWKGKRFHSMVPVKATGITAEPEMKNNSYVTGPLQKDAREQVNHNQAMLDYVRRMTGRVQYTFSHTDIVQPGGGITKAEPKIEDVHSLRNDVGPAMRDTKLQTEKDSCTPHIPSEIVLEPEFEPKQCPSGDPSAFEKAESKEEQKVIATDPINASLAKLPYIEQKVNGTRPQEGDPEDEQLPKLSMSDHWSVFSF